MDTINCTPTWSGLLPALFLLLKSGNPEAKQTAEVELTKMATIADAYVDEVHRRATSGVPITEAAPPPADSYTLRAALETLHSEYDAHCTYQREHNCAALGFVDWLSSSFDEMELADLTGVN